MEAPQSRTLQIYLRLLREKKLRPVAIMSPNLQPQPQAELRPLPIPIPSSWTRGQHTRGPKYKSV